MRYAPLEYWQVGSVIQSYSIGLLFRDELWINFEKKNVIKSINNWLTFIGFLFYKFDLHTEEKSVEVPFES